MDIIVRKIIEKQLWIIDETETSEKMGFKCGTYVFQVLNNLNSILDDITENDITPGFYEVAKRIHNDKDLWCEHISKLREYISKKESYSKEEKYTIYHTYKYLPLYIELDVDIEDVFLQKKYKQNITYETFSNIEDKIILKDLLLNEDGDQMYVYKLKHLLFLFQLDLWELLFNPSLNTKYTICQNCNMVFSYEKKNTKYCSACKRLMNKIQYEKIKHSPRITHRHIYSTLKQLLDNDKIEENILNDFLSISNFLYRKVKGKSEEIPLIIDKALIERITSIEDYEQWTIEYYNQLKKDRKEGKLYTKSNSNNK